VNSPRRIAIDPVTRLEGHGRVELFLDDAGEVRECFLQVPELRGFEKLCVGRPAEEMPLITSRICGVCPEAHMMASAKACDALWHVTPPHTARLLRELQYDIFFVTDHATHFYALAAPDFVMGPRSDPAERNLLGVIRKLGREVAGEVLKCRQWGHEAAAIFGGKPVNPVNAVPGGVSKPLSSEERRRLADIVGFLREFAQFTLKLLRTQVLANDAYRELILNGPFRTETYSIGLVDENNRLSFYDGQVRVMDPAGKEHSKFAPADYAAHLAERVEPWTYMKLPYLRQVGWNGLVAGEGSGVYRATPQARLNVTEGLGTPLAQEAYEEYFETLTGDRSGRTPVHHTLAIHWARVIEMIYAAEKAMALVKHPDITHPEHYRALPSATPTEGVGCVEAPRGTLFHHYVTDANGIVQKVNLIVGTTNNHAAMCLSLAQAARGLIHGGVVVDEGLLNTIELALRAYDPCYGCATHTLPGEMPLRVRIHDADGDVLREIVR
jgi:F420-non-reducing hydrogenase large subunit